ncbi:MFS general substrate transporter [Ramaria rubella]|nr:MFS general substrate transporter [Ramaria rubella]
MSETTPLLGNTQPIKQDVYDRFTIVKKQLITTVICIVGILGPFAAGCFVPCVPEVAKDLKTTGVIINYTIGLYITVVALGSLIWAPYAGFYGRRPIYLTCLPLVCIGSLEASLAKNVLQLVLGRSIQAFGVSCVMSVGAATVADIYRLEERGTAMGIYFGVILLGPALAPFVGGILATYVSWRATQLLLFFLGLVAFSSVALFLPETSHPGSKGLDIFKELQGNKFLSKKRAWHWVWLNPLTALSLLQGPVILFVSLAAAFALITFYVLTVPLSYTLGPRYGLTSPVLVGVCLIPSGIGNIVGAIIAGRLADREVIQGRVRRVGEWIPEDRLRTAIPGALVILPLSLLIFGVTNQFISGTLGLVINLVCLFLNGMGVNIVLAPSVTYIADVFRSRSVETIAVYSAFRNIFCAIACAGVLPLINKVGVFATNALTAVLAWLAFALLWLTIKYGPELRAWLDIGYAISVQET